MNKGFGFTITCVLFFTVFSGPVKAAEALIDQLRIQSPEYKELSGPPAGDLIFQDCNVSHQLPSSLKQLRVVPVDLVKGETNFTAWWEIRSADEFPADRNWESPNKFKGKELKVLSASHEYLKGPWFLSTQDHRNIPVKLIAAWGVAAPINKEITVTLEFSLDKPALESQQGIITSPKLDYYNELPIRGVNKKDQPDVFKNILRKYGTTKNPPYIANWIGDIAVVLGPAEKLKSTMIVLLDEQVFIVKDVPGVWKDKQSYAKYVRAFQTSPNSIELLYRREGRYASWETYYSFTKEGLKRCISRTIGSD
jgi:hypothetical protein